MIYFIQCVSGGPIKIGYAVDIDSRVKVLERNRKEEMVVLYSMAGGRKEEKELHERFAHLRLDKRKEDFRPAVALTDFIAKRGGHAKAADEKRGCKFQIPRSVWERLQLMSVKTQSDCSSIVSEILDRSLPQLRITTGDNG